MTAAIAGSPGTSLLTEPADPVLFTSAGMHPLTPYLEGRPHPLGSRLVNVQRCLRTTDLEEVGDATHLTVFQMLGSWSLGDYDGPQSLRWGYELLTDGFGLPPGRLHATVFGGNDEVGPDERSTLVWTELGVPVEPLVEDNWWSNGPVGPCGPDSEIFVWTGDGPPVGTPSTDDRWVEVWNHVMLRLHRHPDGSPDHAAAAQRRHRHGPGTDDHGAAGEVVGVRDRSLRAVGPEVGGLWPLDGTDHAHRGRPPPLFGRGVRRRGRAGEHRTRVRAAPPAPPASDDAVAGSTTAGRCRTSRSS